MVKEVGIWPWYRRPGAGSKALFYIDQTAVNSNFHDIYVEWSNLGIDTLETSI